MNLFDRNLKEQVLDILTELGLSTVKREEGEYTQVAPLFYDHFGIDKGSTSRKLKNYDGLSVKIKNKLFIRVDFIPWYLANLYGNHNPSDETLQRIAEFLDRLGISTPERLSYLYFIRLEETGEIKIGFTSNLESGDRPYRLGKTYGEITRLHTLRIRNVDKWEKEVHRLFKHLHVENEIFKPEKELMDFIKNLKG